MPRKNSNSKQPPKIYFRRPRKSKGRILASTNTISDFIMRYSENPDKKAALSQLRNDVYIMTNTVNNAIRGLERKGNAMYSFAASQYRNTGLPSYHYTVSEDGKNIIMSDVAPLLKKSDIQKMGYHQLIAQAQKAMKFLNSESSYREGIKKLNYEQDKRIFGVDEYNQPKAQMTQQQRTKFWTLYNEFMNMNPVFNDKQYSTIVQMFVGRSTNNTFELTPTYLDTILENVRQKLREEYMNMQPNTPSVTTEPIDINPEKIIYTSRRQRDN